MARAAEGGVKILVLTAAIEPPHLRLAGTLPVKLQVRGKR
jgi:hypothetical protein